MELGIISRRILYLNANVQIGVLDLQSVLAIITVAKRIRYFFLKIGRVITEPNKQVQTQGQDECEFEPVLLCFDNDQDGFIIVIIKHRDSDVCLVVAFTSRSSRQYLQNLA